MTELESLKQAEQLANNTLKHHARLLGQNEPAVLNNFLKKLSKNTERRKLSDRDCQKIFNIAESVNRRYLKKISRRSNTQS